MKDGFLVMKILEWRKTNCYNFPWRNTKNFWHALVAEIMLQRTKAEQVMPVFNEFCLKYKTPSDYVREQNCKMFERLGLKWRAKELYRLAEILAERGIPSKKEELIKLPGVGEYIASAFRSLHLDQFDVIIDSNVVRLYGRYYGFRTDGETRRKKWFKEIAELITPKKEFRDYNYGLIDFTRTICKQRPICSRCSLFSFCGNKN